MQEIDIPIPPTEETEIHKRKALLDRHEDIFDKLKINRIPFKTRLSFAPMFELIQEKAEKVSTTEGVIAQMILDKLTSVPAMQQPIEDESVLAEHWDLVDLLMTMVVPPFRRQYDFMKVSAPFEMK
ncbi:MAG TPA: hypothetical protein VJ933_13130, partial [Phaeodactylibacter sp.]|nr:hypothetical protein [Phaeodactylibacter sp.]